MADLLSTKFRKSIEESDFTDQKLSDLYDAVKGMSDEDFKEYMYVNRAYFSQNMPAAVESIPGFQSYLSKEPSWGERNIDYKKITGADDPLSDENFYRWTMKDFDEFGKEAGMTGKEFMQQMAKDKTARDRYKIAHFEDRGGWSEAPFYNLVGAFQNVFAPRTQKAIEQGEDPSWKDVAMDVGTDALQALPMGKITKVPKATKAFGLRNILANAAVPATQETADWALYEDKEFDPTDIIKGTAANIVVPRGLRRYGSDKWDDIGKNVSTKRIPGVRTVLNRGPQGTISDFVSNKVGDIQYSDKAVAIPVIGTELEKDKKEKEIIKKKNKAKKKAEEKYKIIIDMDEENKE